MKRRTKARIIWFSTLFVALVCTGVLLFPVFSDFSYLKTGLAASISQQSGMRADIDGTVKITLLPQPMLRAHGVSIRSDKFNADAESVQFPIRISDILNPANISVPHSVVIRDGKLNDKWEFERINGRMALDGREFYGSFYHNGKKYLARINNDHAEIESPAYSLFMEFDYKVFSNGLEASGKFKGAFNNLEKFLESFGYSFGESAQRPWTVETDFVWGLNSLNLDNLNLSSTDTMLKGRAVIPFDTGRPMQLNLKMTEGDLGILKSPELLTKEISISGEGRFLFDNLVIKKFEIHAAPGNIKKAEIQGDDFSLRGRGEIKDGKPNGLLISLYKKDGSDIIGMAKPVSIRCSLWGDLAGDLSCTDASINTEKERMTGAIHIKENELVVHAQGLSGMDKLSLIRRVEKLGAKKDIHVSWSKEEHYITTNGVKNFHDMNAKIGDIPFRLKVLENIPANIKQKLYGEITAQANANDAVSEAVFIMNSDLETMLYKTDGGETVFDFKGNDLGKMLGEIYPGFDGRFIRPETKFTIEGRVRDGDFSEIKIDIAGQKFTGRGNEGKFVLQGTRIDLDALIDPDWNTDFEKLQYLHQDPIATLFRFGADFSLSADTVILGGREYGKLIYSKTEAQQKASFTDGDTGTILAEITRRGGTEYEVSIKAAGFKIPGFLIQNAGLNIFGTSITGEALLSTFGLTANDIRDNIEGTADLVMEGGRVMGIDTGVIYNAGISRHNIGEFLARAFSPSVSMEIKSLALPLRINGAEMISSAPFNLKSDTSVITGEVGILPSGTGAKMSVIFKNATPEPRPLDVLILNGEADFDVEEALNSVNPDYIKAMIHR